MGNYKSLRIGVRIFERKIKKRGILGVGLEFFFFFGSCFFVFHSFIGFSSFAGFLGFKLKEKRL